MKSHLDLLQLTQESSKSGSDGTMSCNDSFLPEIGSGETQLANRAAALVDNAIASARALMKQCEAAGDIFPHLLATAHGECNNLPPSNYNATIKELAQSVVNETLNSEQGDVVSCGKGDNSGTTSVMSSIHVEKDTELSKAYDNHTTASQLSSDSMQPFNKYPLIVLTHPNGVTEVLHQQPQLSTFTTQCGRPQASISLNQESLAKDDTISSGTATISKVSNDHNTGWDILHSISEQTELSSSSQKDLEKREDNSEKLSSHTRQTTASLQIKSSDLSLSVDSSSLPKDSVGQRSDADTSPQPGITKKKRNGVELPGLTETNEGHETRVSAKEDRSNKTAAKTPKHSQEQKTPISVCIANDPVEEMTLHVPLEVVQNRVVAREDNTSTCTCACATPAANICYKTPPNESVDEEDFLLAEAESAFFADFENNDVTVCDKMFQTGEEELQVMMPYVIDRTGFLLAVSHSTSTEDHGASQLYGIDCSALLKEVCPQALCKDKTNSDSTNSTYSDYSEGMQSYNPVYNADAPRYTPLYEYSLPLRTGATPAPDVRDTARSADMTNVKASLSSSATGVNLSDRICRMRQFQDNQIVSTAAPGFKSRPITSGKCDVYRL